MKLIVPFAMTVLLNSQTHASDGRLPLPGLKNHPMNCKVLFYFAEHREKFKLWAPDQEVATPQNKSEPATPLILAIAREIPIYDVKQLLLRLDPNQSPAKLPESVKATLESIAARGPNRFAIAASNLAALNSLAKKMPNFSQALEVIQDALQLSIDSGLPARIPPLLLLGDPGIGKTFFATLLAEALGTGSHFISMNGVTGGFVLAGNTSQWKDSKMGRVAEALIAGKDANPIVVLDEVDKVARTSNHDPMAPLYTLLEEKTARKFRDEFLEMDLDASLINWIATANDYDSIPTPIQSRFLRIEVPKPSPEELKIIISEILGHVLRTKLSGVPFSNEVSQSVFEKLSAYSPRQIQNVMALAVGHARRKERRHLEPQDINIKLIESTHRSIGF